MSIEIENAETPLELADAISNLVEQMALAHRCKDEKQFDKALKLAREHCFELVDLLQDSQ